MAELIATELRPSRLTRKSTTAPVNIDPQTSVLRVRIPRPSTPAQALLWPDTVTLTVSLFIEVDGVVTSATGKVSGGLRTFHGVVRDEYSLAWTVPHGFFDTDKVAPADYSTLRAQRIGETAKVSYRAWVEVEHLKGGAVTLPVRLDQISAPADLDARYHHSIAIENASSAVESAGDGTISLSFTANSGSNRAALVVAGSDRSGQVGTHTVTYGGASASITRPWNVTDSSYSRCTGDVFIDSEIGSGAKTVQNVCDVSTDGGTTLAVLCLSGVNQTTPVGTAVTQASTGGTGSVTVGSINSTDVVVDGVYVFGGAPSVGANQTSRTNANDGSNFTLISTQLGTDGGVMSWSGGSGEFSYGAVAFKEAAGSGFTGTSTVAIGQAAVSASGTQTHSGTSGLTIGQAVVAATGTQTHTGTSSVAIGQLTLAATGTFIVLSGTSAIAIGQVTVAASGTQTHTGTSGVALGQVTVAATGSHGFAGTSGVAIGQVTLGASGTQTHSGTSSVAISQVAVESTGTQTQTGTAGLAIGQVTLAASGTHGADVDGTSAIAIGQVVVAATGSHPFVGTSGLAIGQVVVAASGTHTHTGTAAVAIGQVVLSSSGTHGFAGTAAVLIGVIAVAASGTQSQAGTSALLIGALVMAASGTVTQTGTTAIAIGTVTVTASGTFGVVEYIEAIGYLEISAIVQSWLEIEPAVQGYLEV